MKRAADMQQDLPRSTQISIREEGPWILTNGVWENSYGSYQPETGVRHRERLDERGRMQFGLVQHGWIDFDAADDVILRGLRKGWSCDRIETLMARLKERRRIRARTM